MTQFLDRPSATLMPIGRYEWERLVRRIVMPERHKLVALLLSTWADPDGSRVRPGMPLLAAARGKSERSTSNIVRSLAHYWGLIEQVSRGGGRGGRGKTAEWRLTMPTDLLDRHVLLGPDGLPDSSEPQASGHSEVSSEVLASGQSEPDDVSPEPQASGHCGQLLSTGGDNSFSSEPQASTQSNGHRTIHRKPGVPMKTSFTGSSQRLIGSSALPTTTHVTNHQQTTTPPELPTQPSPERDEPVDNPERSPPGLTLDELLPLAHPPKPPPGPKCGHGLAAGTTPDGQPRCPLCRRQPPQEPT
jgi:hypothetical protein